MIRYTKSKSEWFFVLLLTSLAAVVIAACEHPNEVIVQSRPHFAIDLQDGFQRDTVQVRLDNQVIFYDTATTSLTVGMACRLTPAVAAGFHRIHVSILNPLVQADTIVGVQDTLVVGVNLNRNPDRLTFALYHFWIMYR